MAEQDLSERIVMSHPDLEFNQVTTRKALQGLWSRKGWEEIQDADPDDPDMKTLGKKPPASKGSKSEGGEKP